VNAAGGHTGTGPAQVRPETARRGEDRQTFRNRDGGQPTNYDGIQLMGSARSWAAGVPLNEALGVFRFRGETEGGFTVTEVRRA